MNKTRFFSQEERKWVVVDAKDKVLGRLSTRIAKILQGKHKPTYSPNSLCGDKVIVINADYIKVTGNKKDDKMYDKYSGYPAGRKAIPLKKLMEKNASLPLYLAVKGMLPRNWLGKRMLRSLKIYPQEIHEQTAQKPRKIEV